MPGLGRLRLSSRRATREMVIGNAICIRATPLPSSTAETLLPVRLRVHSAQETGVNDKDAPIVRR